MKKNVLPGLILSMIFLSGVAFSQVEELQSSNANERKTPKTYFDLMVNVVSTNVNYGELNSTLADYRKSANRIQAGVSFQAGVTPNFSLVSELYFMQKGGKLKANNPLTSGESSLLLNSIELPILARLHMGKFYLNAGPSIAYNLGGSTKIADQTKQLSFKGSLDGFNRWEAGIQMGGGIEFPFKQKRIALDIRYNHGLTNVANDKEVYNRALMISVHFSKGWKTNPLASE